MILAFELISLNVSPALVSTIIVATVFAATLPTVAARSLEHECVSISKLSKTRTYKASDPNNSHVAIAQPYHVVTIRIVV